MLCHQGKNRGMSVQKPIFVIESNDFVAKKLRGALAAQGHSEEGLVAVEVPKGVDSAVIHLSAPIRVGRVIDQILHFQRDGAADQQDILSFGGCRLDRYQGVLSLNDGDEPVRLTEKEVALLVLLYEAGGEAIAREVLLEKIWQYADNVETHTLETHIYRLRQKIEKDPAEPTLLRTSEQGYFLSFE